MNKLGLFKSMAIGLMLLAGTVSASAQKENIFGMANRVGVGVGVGTEGIGACCLCRWCGRRLEENGPEHTGRHL